MKRFHGRPSISFLTEESFRLGDRFYVSLSVGMDTYYVIMYLVTKYDQMLVFKVINYKV